MSKNIGTGTLKVRRAAQKVTLTALQAQIATLPTSRERTALRRSLRARGLLGPIQKERRGT